MALPAGSEAHPTLFKTLLASPEDLHTASVAHFLYGKLPLVTDIVPYGAAAHLPPNFKFNINETSEAEGIADHVTLLRLLNSIDVRDQDL